MSEQKKTQQKLIESWELIQGLEGNLKACEDELEVTEGNLKACEDELEVTEKKLVEAEARVETIKATLPTSTTDAVTAGKLLVIQDILSESPSDALRAYEQERFRERTNNVLQALESINACHGGLSIFSCPCPNLLTDALATLKKERGE